jgi:type IV secretory pathway VirB9-like protein
VKTWIFAAITLAALAALAARAAAADVSFRTIQYRPYEQMTVVCPVNLLCVLRLEPGERIRNGLNSQLGVWESNDIYEGGDEQTPMLTFKPQAQGLRANVIVTTNRRTYIVLLESSAGDSPTYIRFAYDAESRARARELARSRPAAAPRPLTISERLDAACSWMSTNAPGETYDADPQPVRWRPARVCHDARTTWLALAPLSTVATDLPVLHELTPGGERIVNYSVFATDRIIRVDGVADGYVLRAGGKDAMHVHRVPRATVQATAQATAQAPLAVRAPDATLTAILGGERSGR